MSFEEEYQKFISKHIALREGESRLRLETGIGVAEKLFLEKAWWPIYQHFHYLHPEYEVNDFKDGTRFLDFAYLRPGIKICFEIDGFGPHQKNATRWKFNDDLRRQNHLRIDGWTVIRFSYDQVNEEPKQCQQTIQQIIGKMLGEELDHPILSYREREVVRLLMGMHNQRITPKELCTILNITFKTARKILNQLLQKNIIYPASSGQRIRYYRLNEELKNPFLK